MQGENIVQVTNNQKTSFQGTFVVHPKSKEVKDAIPTLLKKGRQIFYDIKKEGDVAIVTQDKYDKRIFQFVKDKGLIFSYYPEISTKSGLDTEKPEILRALIKKQRNCIVFDPKPLEKFMANNKNHLKNQIEYITEAINSLRLNVENFRIKLDETGKFIIRDDAKQRTIKSTGFNNGMGYFYIRPDSLWADTHRFLIGANGKQIIKEYSSPEELRAFNKAFIER